MTRLCPACGAKTMLKNPKWKHHVGPIPMQRITSQVELRKAWSEQRKTLCTKAFELTAQCREAFLLYRDTNRKTSESSVYTNYDELWEANCGDGLKTGMSANRQDQLSKEEPHFPSPYKSGRGDCNFIASSLPSSTEQEDQLSQAPPLLSKKPVIRKPLNRKRAQLTKIPKGTTLCSSVKQFTLPIGTTQDTDSGLVANRVKLGPTRSALSGQRKTLILNHSFVVPSAQENDTLFFLAFLHFLQVYLLQITFTYIFYHMY
ncbi:hypothetical protein CAPTEDRAFT_204860 [Capitella teleta]|uniref:Uncharacterized protein n=1 Tax=Capitella teleta TaxID=283909 RepID=R7TUK7_CAPTE|nr:hypothetical protein CAPTEDRAFT_204860 [Capitella teleta]|eukprot:ELT97344.1 hypothetical protein CAPTEDRAFT_204860 [Capitella teleta]